MKRREMNWAPRYGLDHPLWGGPDCWLYATAEAAAAAIVKVYGADSGHVVVEMRRVTP